MTENQDATSLRSISIQKASKENVTKVMEIKNRISAEIEQIDDDISEIEKLRQESIEKIELKKKELKELSGVKEFCEDKTETMKEILKKGREIEARKISITALDGTIAILDKQIAEIQAKHDKATAKLDLKKRKLNQQLEYYDLLNQRLTDLLNMLQKEVVRHEDKLVELKQKRSEVLKEDLDDVARLEKISELDDEIEALNKEHDFTIQCIDKSLADMEAEEAELFRQEAEAEAEAMEALLTEEQLDELEIFEGTLYRTLYPHMSSKERLALLRRGLQITPSGRIIMGDRVITLTEARLLGLLDDLKEVEEEEEKIELIEVPPVPESKIQYYAPSTISEVSSSEKSSSLESELDQQDIDYLKRVFGKSLSLALAEITAVQPSDPIHYLAHWFIKYRHNQDIEAVRQIELQALMIERERLEAERWHKELEDEAHLAVMEALFRAENIILQHDYEKLEMMLDQELEGEGFDEDSVINPMEYL